MNNRLTRHEMTQKDEFVSAIEKGAGWLEQNWRKVVLTIAGMIGGFLVLTMVVNLMGAQGRKADAMLGEAMTLMSAPVLQAGELPPLSGATTFNSRDERDEAVLAKVDEVLASYPSSKAAASAAYLRGPLLLSLGRSEDARAALATFNREYGTSAMQPAARRALAAADLQAGRTDEALTILEELVNSPSVLFPVDAAIMELGRAQESSGRIEDALASYRRLVNEYPQSAYSSDARQAVIRLSDPQSNPS